MEKAITLIEEVVITLFINVFLEKLVDTNSLES